MSPVTPEIGERIIASFDQLGGLEGSVVRAFDGGFAISFVATQHKREKLEAQLIWILNRQDLGLPDGRRHDRISLKDKKSCPRLDDGTATDCEIIDVSLSGAAISTTARPAIGDIVTLGKLRARVRRHHDQGIGVEFVDIQEPEALRRHFG